MLRRIANIVLLTFVLHSGVFAQEVNPNLTISVEDSPLSEILDSISSNTGYNFSYNSMILPIGSLFSFSSEDEPIDEALVRLLEGTNISFTIDGDQIILKMEVEEVKKKNKTELTFDISGRIFEKDSKELIPGVNVYLDGTSLGTVSNENGYFRIQKIPFGNYKIVFSHIAYGKKVYDFTRSVSKELTVNTEMDFSSSELKPVEVLANPVRYRNANQDYVDIFNDEFLGTSLNSADCKILNPETISYEFNADERTLKAAFSEPLIVQNNALGYLLFCELDYFRSTNNSVNVKYTGRVRFEELTAQTNFEIRKWKNNRKKSYYGSIRHFFKQAVRNKHRQHGFRVYSISSLEEISTQNLSEIPVDEFLIPTENPGLWRVEMDKLLYIVFTKELESDDYMIDMEKDILRNMTFSTNKLMFINRKPDVQKSLIEMEMPEAELYVDVNGNLTNPEVLSVSGYWSWERIAELVPINYDPKNKLN